MKKIMSLLCAAIFCLCGFGCANTRKPANSDDNTGNNPVVTPPDGDNTGDKPGNNTGEQSDKFAPDPDGGYTAAMGARFSIADFSYGAELPYARYNEHDDSSWHARSFAYDSPRYSYTPAADEEDLKYKANCGWIDAETADDCNYYTVYGAESGAGSGTVVADYRTYVPSLQEAGTPIDGYGMYPADYENLLDLSGYDKLVMDFSSEAKDGGQVGYKIKMRNRGYDFRQLFYYSGEGGRKTIEINLKDIPAAERDKVEIFRFEQVVSDITVPVVAVNKIYSIDAYAEKPFIALDTVNGGLNVHSEYLGNMLYTKWGAYSASGFYDSQDKKWKLWYGAGLPEHDSSDNVYYIETTDLSKPWSKPHRIVMDDSTGYKLIDPSGKLKRHDEQIGYGGDPSVIKVDGTYYMYFSALENGLNDGVYTHWNKIYVATSSDSKTWTCRNACVNPATGGGPGYGAGSPSVVYHKGEFWMYYYTQAPSAEYPDEPTGLVLKKSKDGIHFDKGIEINRNIGSVDVKYVPSLRKWVGCYYAEAGQYIPTARAGVRIAFSEDGINWNFEHDNEKMPAQNLDYPINHNPGFIGNEQGYGYETMFLTYGANDLPLTVNGYWFTAAQMDARQLEWSRISVS